MGFVHMETITIKQLRLQSYFDSIYLASVVGPTDRALDLHRDPFSPDAVSKGLVNPA
jgi:hypothetical protein